MSAAESGKKKILAFNGSPRIRGNTFHLLQSFAEGSSERGTDPETIRTTELDLNYCTGCLRCNLLKRCAVTGDDWEHISKKILKADVLMFAAPVYFRHLPASLKKVIDRFRSFSHVRITESGLVHTPFHEWNKDFVLILTMGSPRQSEADPVIELFGFITRILGKENRLHAISATGLGVAGQVVRNKEELIRLYGKMDLPDELAVRDFRKNKEVLERCKDLGAGLAQT